MKNITTERDAEVCADQEMTDLDITSARIREIEFVWLAGKAIIAQKVIAITKTIYIYFTTQDVCMRNVDRQTVYLCVHYLLTNGP